MEGTRRCRIPECGTLAQRVRLTMAFRSSVFFFLLALDLIFLSRPAKAEFVWTNIGLTGNAVHALAIDPDNPQNIYAGVDYDGLRGGIFRRISHTNASKRWIRTDSGTSNSDILAIAIDPVTPQTVYAVTTCVLKSTNGGLSWDTISGDLGASCIAIDPKNPGTVYAGVQGGYILKIEPGGAHWFSVPSRIIYCIAIDSKDTQILYAGTANGLFRSSDGGKNWEEPSASGMVLDSVFFVVVDPQNTKNVYSATNAGLFKSVDGGARFSYVSGTREMGFDSLAIDPERPQILYAGSWGHDGGAFKSTDGGETWKSLRIGATTMAVYSFALVPGNTKVVYAATMNNGLWKSKDGGTTWEAVNSSTRLAGIWSVAIDPQNEKTIYAGTRGRGVFKTTNGGARWYPMDSGLTKTPVYAVAMDPDNTRILYAGTYGRGVFKSTNGGSSWKEMSSGLEGQQPIVYSLAINPKRTHIVYSGTKDGIFKSANGGSSWKKTGFGFTTRCIYSLAVDPKHARTVYAGTDLGLFKSTDGGASWLEITPQYVFGNDTYSVAISLTNPRIVYAVCGHNLFKSIDRGASWSLVSSKPIYSECLALHPKDIQVLFVGGVYGVYRSVDGGVTFDQVNSSISALCLAIDPENSKTVYAGDYFSGVFVGTDESPESP